MFQLVKNLRNNGVKEKYLRDDESIVVSHIEDGYVRFAAGSGKYIFSVME